MKIKILKRTPEEIELELQGVGHTFCNLLQKRLLDEKEVDLAGYNIPHPLASNPTVYVRTKGNLTPEKALRKAVKSATEMNKEFRKELEKALKT